MEKERSLGDYSLIIKQKQGRYTAHIPELAIVVEGDSLENIYREIVVKKEKALLEFAEIGERPPAPQNLPLLYFSWKFVVIATAISLTCAVIVATNVVFTQGRNASTKMILDEIKSSRETSAKELHSALDVLSLKVRSLKNRALNKPATQSSYFPGYPNSNGAVDGIKTGEIGFHTEAENNPWWQVDLNSDTQVELIRIYNRICCKDLAKTLQILFSSDGKSWRTVYVHDGSVFGGIDGNYLEVPFVKEHTRFVRLQISGFGHFNLDEVEIYGPPEEIRNADSAAMARKPVLQTENTPPNEKNGSAPTIIETSPAPQTEQAPVPQDNPPRLVEANYKGYNIVYYQGLYYGLSLSEGELDVREIRTKARYKWVADESISALELQIDKLPPIPKPPLLERIARRVKRMFGG